MGRIRRSLQLVACVVCASLLGTAEAQTLPGAAGEPRAPAADVDPQAEKSAQQRAKAGQQLTGKASKAPKASEALKDSSEPTPPPPQKKPKPPRSIYGIGLHLRSMFVHEWMLKPFFQASTSVNSVALGGEFVWRRGSLDIVGSVDFGFYGPSDGNYLEQDADASTETDYIDFRGLNGLGIAVHLIKHETILPWLSFVWGGGLGLAVVFGDIFRASNRNTLCNAGNFHEVGECNPGGTFDPQNPALWMTDPRNQGSEAQDSPLDPRVWKEDSVPPVVPILHLLAGFNFKLSRAFNIRVDGGFRNAFYFGATGHYFF